MKLNESKLNTNLIVKNINADEKTKLRLMELGLTLDSEIYVKHKSLMKKTMLVIFNYSCFTIKEEIAKLVEVNYA